MKNIAALFFEIAHKHPNQVAFQQGNNQLTYTEMAELVSAQSKDLHQKNIKSGDRVLLAVPVGISFYVSVLALFSVGATVVLTDNFKNKKTVEDIFFDMNCVSILTNRKIWWLRYFVLSKRLWKHCQTITKHSERMLTESIEVDGTQTALITFTSGSTGKPKAANRTHEFLHRQLQAVVEEMKIDSNSVHLSSLPVVSLCNLASGAETVLKPTTSQIERINLVSGSPYHVHNMLKTLTHTNNLRVFIGGSVIYPAFAEMLREQWPQTTCSFAYGSTEAEPMAVISLADYQKDLNELGVPVGTVHKNLELTIETMLVFDDLEIGEILVRGNHVLPSYMNAADNEKKYKNGWLKTGDIGYLLHGRLFFLGRRQFCWIENGRFHSPLDVERLNQRVYPKATQLQINGERVLFYERDIEKSSLEIIHQQYTFDREVSVPFFAYDKRHNSRIRYDLLEKELITE